MGDNALYDFFENERQDMILYFCMSEKCMDGQLNFSDFVVRAGRTSVCVVSASWLLPLHLTRHVAEPDRYTQIKKYFINSNNWT